VTTELDTLMSKAGVELSDRDEQARRAVKNFRALQPTLTAYARMLTKRNDVIVEMAARDNGSTDGTRIRYRPPMALGDTTPHVRKLCDKRDDRLQLLCKACFKREEVLVVIYHEIAHLCFDSFAEVTDVDRARLIEDAVAQVAGRYAKFVTKRIQSAPPHILKSYIGISNYVSPFLPFLVNCLEDARVNRELFKSRKGTKKMFDSMSWRTFTHGVEQKNPAGEIVVIPWNEYPQNMQVTIGLFCKASGYDYSDWFVKPVVEALNDEKLTDLIRKMDTIRSAAGVYNLSFPVLARLRELGFCKLDSDPTDEEEEDDQTDDDSTPAETDDSSGDDADDSSESDSDEASSDPEGEASDSSGDDETSDGDSGDDGSASPTGSGTVPDRGDEGEEPDSDDLEVDEDDHSDGAGDSDGPASDGEGSDDSGESVHGQSEVESDDVPDSGRDDLDDSDGTEAEVDSDDDRSEEASGSGGESDVEDSDDGNDVTDDDSQDDGSSDEGSTDEAGDDSDSDGDSSTAEQGTDEADGGPVDDDSTDRGQDDLAEPTRSPGDDGDGERALGGDSPSDPDQDHGEGSEGDSDGDPEDLGQTSDEAESGPDNGQPEGDRSESESDSGSLESEQQDQTDNVIDTGADEGLGGVRVEEADEDYPEMGDASDVEDGLKQWGAHDEPDKTSAQLAKERADEKAIDKAIVQGMYFEMPSQNVAGVKEYRFDDTTRGDGWDNGIFTASGYSLKLGIEGDFEPPETILGPALLLMRRVFTDNFRGKDQRNLRSGKVNARVLGRRAPFQDERLFSKRKQPGRKKYFVLLGLDISGSTVGVNIALIKRAATAQAELLSRMGIDFAIYAHTGTYEYGTRRSDLNLDIYHIKDADEPWDTRTKERLHQIGPSSCNLDGHTLEYYRKVLDKADATDKILMYYTDGKMPQENHDEELEI
jgi:hypothetical protein